MAASFQKVLGVVGDDTGLIRLSYVGEYNIDLRDEHPVFLR